MYVSYSNPVVGVEFSQITGCTARFCFKLDAVSAPGIPEVERKQMEVGDAGRSEKTQMSQKCIHSPCSFYKVP